MLIVYDLCYFIYIYIYIYIFFFFLSLKEWHMALESCGKFVRKF
jgi:hypothetical protein